MQKKFGVLRFIGGFYKVVGIIWMVIAVLSAIGMCATSVLGTSLLGNLTSSYGNANGLLAGGGILAGIIVGLIIILAGAIMGLGLYGMGELIYLFIAVEENTRLIAMK